MLVDAPARPDSSAGLEALIREARVRQRRRRRRVAALVLLALSGTAAFAIGRRVGGGAPTVVRIPNGPVANVGAFRGHGRLAFVSGSTLWVLDGTAGTLRRLPALARFAPSAPVFSADGKWLAYLERARYGDDSRLWLARADGSGARAVAGLRAVSLVGWSPVGDLLAVSAGQERTKRPCPCYSPTTVRVVSPDGSDRIVARSSWVYGARWSPGGTALAVAADLHPVSTIAVYPVSGGHGTTWLRLTARGRLNGLTGVLFDVAGWWPQLGIGFWVFGDGAVRNNDETPLDLVAAPGASPRLLGQTLSDGTTDAVAAGSRGEVAIVTDHGGGRAAWQDKRVEVCGTGRCSALPHAAGDVTLDPSWAPDGTTLAYIEAPNVRTGPWSQRALAAWFAAHRVFLYDASTGHVRPLPAAHGATAITWSHDGRSMLYVRDDALWLLPALGGKAVRIVAPIFRRAWPQYFAQVAWSSQFGWASNR
ncbi:MAG TPA: hypothetical protein VFA30_11215 [Gaiellaceae bacterium]|nr:hypothetical protein [Gaiellaceae bacterium]